MRQSWNEYFMNVATIVANRSTCPRKKVGCVIVKDKTIISTGYNGSLPKDPHCSDVGCYVQDHHCIRTVHAETNAINQAAKNGVSLKGSTIYCNVEPCWYCYKNIISSGIIKIYFKEPYGNKSKIYKDSIKAKTVHRIQVE